MDQRLKFQYIADLGILNISDGLDHSFVADKLTKKEKDE